MLSLQFAKQKVLYNRRFGVWDPLYKLSAPFASSANVDRPVLKLLGVFNPFAASARASNGLFKWLGRLIIS